jgi:hypothetical protein
LEDKPHQPYVSEIPVHMTTDRNAAY